ncbi:MAG: nitrite reductase (NADH) small subunit, partial [Rhodococcus sp. (in: high G+C Gram-positive bacteria)]
MSVIDAQIAKLDSDRLEWTSACPLSHLIPGRGVA